MIVSPAPPVDDLHLDPVDLAAYQDGDPQAHLDAALAAIRAYVGWHIAPVRTETVAVDIPPWSRGVGLPTLCLLAVVPVDQDGIPFDLEPALEWTRSGLVTWPCDLAGTYYDARPTTAWLTITHGYPALPAEVHDTAMRLATRSQVSPLGGGSQTVGPFSVSIPGAITADGGGTGYGVPLADRVSLDRYRIPRVA